MLKKKSAILAVVALLSSLTSFAQTVSTWNNADKNVAKGCPTWISAKWAGEKVNLTDDNLNTGFQLQVTGAQPTEWVVVDLGYNYNVTKISITTQGDRKDQVYAIMVAPPQTTTPAFDDGNDPLGGAWTQAFQVNEEYANTGVTTATYAVNLQNVRYIKYQGVTRNHPDQYGVAIREIRVAGTTNDDGVKQPHHLGVTGADLIFAGSSGLVNFKVYNNGGGELETDPAKISVTSSVPAVATAAVEGKAIRVTGVTAGNAVITINYDGLTLDYPIVVERAIPASPIPTADPADVYSLYSDAYTNKVFNWYDWGGNKGVERVVNGNKMFHIGRFNFHGSQFDEFDATAYDYLHIDFYTPSAGKTVAIFPITSTGGNGNNPERGCVFNLAQDEWTSLDIPLQAFVDNGLLGLKKLYQLKFVGSLDADNGPVNADASFDLVIDNIYFGKNPVADDVAPTWVKAEVAAVTHNTATLALNATDNIAGGTLTYIVKDGDVAVATERATAGTEATVELTDLTPETAYKLTVTVADAAGNTAAARTLAFTTDAAPEVPVNPNSGTNTVDCGNGNKLVYEWSFVKNGNNVTFTANYTAETNIAGMVTGQVEDYTSGAVKYVDGNTITWENPAVGTVLKVKVWWASAIGRVYTEEHTYTVGAAGDDPEPPTFTDTWGNVNATQSEWYTGAGGVLKENGNVVNIVYNENDGSHTVSYSVVPQVTSWPVNTILRPLVYNLPAHVFQSTTFAGQGAVQANPRFVIGSNDCPRVAGTDYFEQVVTGDAAANCFYNENSENRLTTDVGTTSDEFRITDYSFVITFDADDKLVGVTFRAYTDVEADDFDPDAPHVDLSEEVIGEGSTLIYAQMESHPELYNLVARAFDEDAASVTSFNGLSGLQWVGLDLGQARVITSVSYMLPADDYTRGLLGVFQGANDPTFIDAVPLFMITPFDGMQGGKMYTANLINTTPFRYVRYVGPGSANNAAVTKCSIAEIRFGYDPQAAEEEGVVGVSSRKKDVIYRPSNLPLVIVNTAGDKFFDDRYENKSAENTFKKSTVVIVDENGKVNHVEDKNTEIRGRGNSSWGFPKKPFRIKFNKKATVLGSPANVKKWTMINNYGDKTLMRNLVGFEMGRRMGMKYVPFGIPVDLIFNGQYMGTYQLCDQVEVNPGRVDIDEVDREAADYDENTAVNGGFLAEIDAYAFQEDDGAWFKAEVNSTGNRAYEIPVTIKSPDPAEVNPWDDPVYIAMKQSFTTMAQEVFDFNDGKEGADYHRYLDIDDFLRYTLLEDYTANPDAFWSTYMYKDNHEQIWHTGPVWDLDLAFNNDNRAQLMEGGYNGYNMGAALPTFGMYASNGVNWGESQYTYRGGSEGMQRFVHTLVQDNPSRLSTLWSNAWNRQGGINSADMNAFVDKTAAHIKASADLNFLRWPILDKVVHQNHGYQAPTFEEHVANLKAYISTRGGQLNQVYGLVARPDATLDAGTFSGEVIWAKELTNSTITYAEAAKAFDGNAATAPDFNGQEGVQWVGLDLGSKQRITAVGFTPLQGDGWKYAKFGMFQGANNADFSDAVPLYMITDVEAGMAGKHVRRDIEVPGNYRYVRYMGSGIDFDGAPAGCRIADVKFYGDVAGAQGGPERVAKNDVVYRPSNLPMVIVNTPDETWFNDTYPNKHKTNTFAASTVMVVNDDGRVEVLDNATEIRGRGNTSWDAPKKPFRIKLSKNASPLGSPASAKKWTMISNYSDGSLMRNLLAYEMGRRVGMGYVPFAQAVDLVFNGQYMGTYLLSDQIEVDENRIALEEVDREASGFNPAEHTDGGFLVEVDAYADGEAPGEWFVATADCGTTTYDIPVTLKYPEAASKNPTTDPIYLAAKENFERMMGSVYDFGLNGHPAAEDAPRYTDYLYLPSFLRYLLVQEYAGNTGAFWSTYLLKENGDDQWHVGPLWDMEAGFGNDDLVENASTMLYPFTGAYTGYFASNRLNASNDPVYANGSGAVERFVQSILSDPVAHESLMKLWSYCYNIAGLAPDALHLYIDQLAERLQVSSALNAERWAAPTEAMGAPRRAASYEDEVTAVKNYLTTKATAISKAYGYDPGHTTELDAVGTQGVKIAVVGNRVEVFGADQCVIYGGDGRVVYAGNPSRAGSLAAGFYIVKAGDATRKVVIR